jgi:hypothetical protein
MERTESKKTASKSINDFSISSVISKIQLERMKKDLNPSRNKNLGRSISSLNVKIQLKKDEKMMDRLLFTNNDLKRSNSNLKKIAEKEDDKNHDMSQILYALNDELGKTWRENRELKEKLNKNKAEKEKLQSKSQNKVSISNRIEARFRNMNKIVIRDNV